MINKRLLIKNLLSHNDENGFYDKKQKLSLGSKEGKAKFLKHVCALSNANPNNNSYIVIGVKDEENEIVGVDFYDDSKIQNLVNAYLLNPPKVQYENVPFPRLPRHKVVGLVTINPNPKTTALLKGVWKYPKHTIFMRLGSNSTPVHRLNNIPDNTKVVSAIEKNASNNIQHTLDGVFDFMNTHKPEYHPQYKVFKEQFVLCWAGKTKQIQNQNYLTRVDIELINERVRLFFSALDAVQITYNEQSFIITEYISLGVDISETLYPLEKTVIHFKDNGKHDIITEFLFEPPKFDTVIIGHIHENNMKIITKIANQQALSVTEHEDVFKLPTSCLICYLNGYTEAAEQLRKAKNYIKNLPDKTTYIKYKEAMRVLRKVKYA